MHTLDEVGVWLDQQVALTAVVEPTLFRDACIELEVWDEYDQSDIFDSLCEIFEDLGTAAMMRFADVAVCLHDGTLAEFVYEVDHLGLAIPTEVFEAAAVCPFEEGDSFLLDRPTWRREIARRLSRD